MESLGLGELAALDQDLDERCRHDHLPKARIIIDQPKHRSQVGLAPDQIAKALDGEPGPEPRREPEGEDGAALACPLGALVPYRLGAVVAVCHRERVARVEEQELVALRVEARRRRRALGEVRADRRRRAEEAARKVPVKLLFPLVTCTLPAFGLLTVAPLVASAVRSLRL
jgi:hypothetical protein